MNRKGRVLQIHIKTSSGEPLLDLTAIDIIRRAQPFPAVLRILPDPYRVELSFGFDPT